MKRLDVSPWNFGLSLSMLVACGPLVAVDDAGTDTDIDPTNTTDMTDPSSPTDPSDPTVPSTTTNPGGCGPENPCDYGYDCIDGQCIPSNYCEDGPCCDYYDGGCCYYDGCCYGGTGGGECCYGEDGCWYNDCGSLVDCDAGQFCSYNYCEPANTPSECGVQLGFAQQLPALPEGSVLSLSFVETDGDPARELAVGTDAGAGITAVDAIAATPLAVGAAVDVGGGDIDGDGDADLVVAQAGQLTVFHNDGTGAFALGPTDATDAQRIEVADVDGDGIADLVGLLDLGTPTLQLAIMRGLGGGEYDAPYIHSPTNLPNDFELGELFGDPGVELSAFDGEQLSIWRGGPLDGTTDFLYGNVGGAPGSLAIGDFDGDGLADVAQSVTVSGWTIIDVYRSGGDGGFEVAYSQSLIGTFVRTEAADLDLDGRADLVLASDEGAFTVLHGGPWDFYSPFACGATYPTGVGGPVVLALGDYDGDGTPDVAVSDGGTTIVHVRTP